MRIVHGMMIFALATALCLGSAVIGCNSDDGNGAQDSGVTSDASGLAGGFGDSCTDATQCESDVCHLFGDGTQSCTESCTVDGDCPEGSQGQKCNNQGVCRP